MQLNQMRRGAQKASDIESLASQLGREVIREGKHRIWGNAAFPLLPPLVVPRHDGKDLKTGLKNELLNDLENDCWEWEQKLPKDEDEEAEK
jgi:hypothetical protein